MKILAFAATNSKNSINQQLAHYAAKQVTGAQIELIDLNDYEMPIYSQEREAELGGVHPLAQQFYDKIGGADAVIVSFAEHNGSYTAAYKNIFDWTSRINMKVYQDKPVLMLATSPGPGGAQSVLTGAVNSAGYFGIDLKGSLSVASFYDVFDMEAGELKDSGLASQLTGLTAQLEHTAAVN
ncbi:NADPH-dependent FMN reductase [Paraferrimonas sp. SM1919]|uniref:NADPH-dependent FMN reductase n=1 Tax=Paraferrimonas sp. SM1919 TaxID=2662263 RepID=UPI0013D14143|nr:NAD(P)H-dependent oxidoreductase [Paraferrimonas sp. SM1919]